MFLSRMDTENVVHLHNGVLLSYLKEWIYEISRQMDGPGGHYPEWGYPIIKELTWYILTDKWILAQKLSIVRYKIQFAKHMKLKKNEDQSVDTLPLLNYFFNTFIRYFPHLHFQCYPKSPPYPPPHSPTYPFPLFGPGVPLYWDI